MTLIWPLTMEVVTKDWKDFLANTRTLIVMILHCTFTFVLEKSINKSVVVKLKFNSRRQIDFVDFQSQPDREFILINKYQDHPTKFLVRVISEWAISSLRSSGRH